MYVYNFGVTIRQAMYKGELESVDLFITWSIYFTKYKVHIATLVLRSVLLPFIAYVILVQHPAGLACASGSRTDWECKVGLKTEDRPSTFFVEGEGLLACHLAWHFLFIGAGFPRKVYVHIYASPCTRGTSIADGVAIVSHGSYHTQSWQTQMAKKGEVYFAREKREQTVCWDKQPQLKCTFLYRIVLRM